MNMTKVNQIKFVLSMYEDASQDSGLMSVFNKQLDSLIASKQMTTQTKNTIESIITNVYKYRGAEVRIQQFKWGCALIENSGMNSAACLKMLEGKVKEGMFNQKVVDALIAMYDLKQTRVAKTESHVRSNTRGCLPMYVSLEIKKCMSLYRNMAYLRLPLLKEDTAEYFEIDRVLEMPELIDWSRYKATAQLVYRVKNPDDGKCYKYISSSKIEEFAKKHPECCDV